MKHITRPFNNEYNIEYVCCYMLINALHSLRNIFYYDVIKI